MKKIIAAAAGLMIAGTAMVASAAVEFSGDARARYYYQDNYVLSDDSKDSADHWNSRVRLNVKATTAGGSYAKVRLVMQDNGWGNGGNNNSTVDVDRAFVGVPLGCVELTAGRQPLSLTTGYWNDVDLDNVRLKYAQDGTTVIGWYAVLESDTYAASTGVTEYKDSENRLYGIAVMQDFADWNVAAGVSFQDMDLTGITLPNGSTESGGAMATIAVAGPAGPVALAAELGWQEDGVVATDEQAADATGDDGFGAYVTAGMTFDAFGATLVGVATTEGFAFDVPVGFIMLGGDNQITPGVSNVLGYYGDQAVDTYAIGVKTTYQATEALGFGFNLAYANMELSESGATFATGDTTEDDTDAFEISAQAGYAINDGTMLYARAGYLDVDHQDDPIIGAGVSLELSF